MDAWRGAELPEHLRRARELFRHPRPLDDDERRLVREAARPVLRDLTVVGLAPVIEEESRTDRGPQTVTAWVPGPVRLSGQELRVWRAASLPERVVQVAEQLQEWAGDVQVWEDAGFPGRQIDLWAAWPACPEHDGGHSLRATVREGRATWSCPENEHAIAEIGALGDPAR